MVDVVDWFVVVRALDEIRQLTRRRFPSAAPSEERLVDEAALDKCQDVLQYEFRDRQLLAQSLRHASTAADRLDSNERLEFLGDAVLGVVVCNELYQAQADLLEGDMTKIKSLVVSRQICAQISDESGLSDLLSLGKGMAGGQDLPRSVAAAVFEAVIGAIFCDGGFAPAQDYILRMVRPQIAAAIEDEHKANFKSMLQQVAQRKWGATPEYQLLDEKGPDHSKCFEIAVVVRHKHFPSAWGTNKKEAEQAAARRALVEMGLAEPEEG